MIYRLKGVAQHYAWGGNSFIKKLTGQDLASPCAEYWLGAHASAPAIIQNKNNIPLTDYIQSNPAILGNRTIQEFGNRLPYLFKVLDVKSPLSIQLHPTIAQAIEGYKNEDQAGIDLNSPSRIYKDKNHKPEMMVALSDFYLLHGFKSKENIIATLKANPTFDNLVEFAQNESIHSLYSKIMTSSAKELSQWLIPIIQANQDAYQTAQLDMTKAEYWVLHSITTMDIKLDNLDAGLMSFYLMNIVKMMPGQAIYQAAGIPHAYLYGQNIELMANSDNVIRGGLTHKHIDIPELLKIINSDAVVPTFIKSKENLGLIEYPTPAPDFELQRYSAEKGVFIVIKSKAPQILLVTDGMFILEESETDTSKTYYLTKGQAVFIGADTQIMLTPMEEINNIFIATLPRSNN